MKHLVTAINLLAEVPPPPELLYHATPYANEILSGGFNIDPARQTFGGHGTYVSLTTLDNVRNYAEDLKIIVGFLNDELSWKALEGILIKRGLSSALDSALRYVTFNELSMLRINLSEEKQATGMGFEEAYDLTDKEMQELYDRYPKGDLSNQKNEIYTGKDCYGNSVSAEQDLKRRWEVLHALWSSSTGKEDAFTLITSSGVPEHLLGRSMSDVGIIEVAIAPAAPASEMGYESPERMEETKGKYTYNPNEKEWRFYDVTDLWPVRRVSSSRGYIQAAINVLASEEVFHRYAITKRELEYLHDPSNKEQFAIFSAFRSNLSLNENNRRNTEFVQMLNDSGYKWESTGGTWQDLTKEKGYALEGSIHVYNMKFLDAKSIAIHFSQEAILYKSMRGPLGYYDLIKNVAYSMVAMKINTNAPRPRVKEEQGIQHMPSTRWRDTEVVYTFDWDHPIPFSDSPISYDYVAHQ